MPVQTICFGGADMNIKGGYTHYGQDIGILMLNTVFPRIPGDIGNARTFDFPVCYKVVKLSPSQLAKSTDQELLAAFIKAARELEEEGCKAITTACGFLAGFQQELSDAVNIPVFTTTLSLIPMIAPMIGRRKKIAIFTQRRELMTEFLFQKAGWSSKDFHICIADLPEDAAFNELLIRNRPDGNMEDVSASVREMTVQHMEQHPDTGAIVLECQNLAPFGGMIQSISGVPVFGMNQLIAFIESCVNYSATV